MGIYVLHTMSGKDSYLTVSKLQTSCFYPIYFKLIEYDYLQKRGIWLAPFHFASKHAMPSADFLNHN